MLRNIFSKKNRFEDKYKNEVVSWDHDRVDPELVRITKDYNLNSGNALDIGCGKGTDALYLANLGFEVLAVDFTAIPLEIAKERAKSLQKSPIFRQHDFLVPMETEINRHVFAFDRGCFHSMRKRDREKFARNVSYYLKDNGVWLCLCGSKDEKRNLDVGPPRLSLTDMVNPIEKYFEILQVRAIKFGTKDYIGWSMLAKKRTRES